MAFHYCPNHLTSRIIAEAKGKCQLIYHFFSWKKISPGKQSLVLTTKEKKWLLTVKNSKLWLIVLHGFNMHFLNQRNKN